MSLKITGLNVWLNKKQILYDINLEVNKGALLSVLGPSGCGKSTLLKTVSGFIQPDSGVMHLGELELNPIEPQKRNIVMVFQDIRLFPHLNVAENVGFALKMSGIDKREIAYKIQQMLKLVQLGGLEKRKPSQLSGGQQQRVALARALISSPDVLLLDEPFSGLDTNLRIEMQYLLKELHKNTGTTMIFVTHDYEEALALSDYICIMEEGRIVQYGTPEEIYKKPVSVSAAKYFCGNNVVEGVVENGIFTCPLFCMNTEKENGNYTAVIYPANIALNLQGEQGYKITDKEFKGDYSKIFVEKDGCKLAFKVHESLPQQDFIGLKIDTENVLLYKD